MDLNQISRAKAKADKIAQQPQADPNAKFLVGKLSMEGTTISVYLLNAKDFFADFGGSRSGLVVNKTASLIVREQSTMGCRDTEYDLADKQAWFHIFRIARSGARFEQL